MPLQDGLKAALVDRFCPILCIDPDEPSYPVSPLDYVRHCALWASTPPDHPRMDWGLAGAAGREPLVAHGGIVLDADGNARGVADREAGRPRERWLDHGGWLDGREVLPSSSNRRAGIGGAALEQPWFVADVWTLADLAEGVGSERMAERFGLGPEDRPPQFERVAVVSFGFLFPGHRQPRLRTLRDPADDPWSGDYEGDWCHFSLVLRCGEEDPAGAGVDDFTPLSGAFGQRFRGTRADRDDHATERALLRPWPSLMRVGEHPVVVASAGIHNLHPHDPPLGPGGGIDLQWVDFGKSISEPASAFVQDAVEQPAAALFSAKVLAGAAAGGFFGGLAGAVVGAIVGGIAAAAEAVEAEKEGLYEVPDLDAEPAPDPPGDDPLTEDAIDLEKEKMGKPASAPHPPFFDPAQGESRDWACTADQALADGARVVAIQNGLLAAGGRWGVRCDGDRFQIRSGLKLPAYRFHVVDALLRQV